MRRIGSEAAWFGFFVLAGLMCFAFVYRQTLLAWPAAAAVTPFAIWLASRSCRRVAVATCQLARGIAAWRGSATAIILAGIFVRLVVAAAFPLPQYSDAADYVAMAKQLAAFEQIHISYRGFDRLYAWRAPGWPMLLAPFFAAFGATPPLIVYINILLSVLYALLVRSLLVAVADRPASLLGMALAMASPGLIAYTSLALTEPLSLLLFTAAFRPLLLPPARVTARRAAALGLAGGAFVLVRPSVLTFVALAPVYVLVIMRRLPGADCVRALAGYSAGVGLVMLPWAVRNYLLLGEVIVLTTMGGANLYFANNPVAHLGLDAMERDLFAHAQSEVDLHRLGTAWAIEWIMANPSAWLLNTARKFTEVVGDSGEFVEHLLHRGHGVGTDNMLYSAVHGAANLWWGALWLLGANAMWRWRRVLRGHPVTIGWVAMIAYFPVIHSIYQGVARYNIPMGGVLITLACLSVSRNLTLTSLIEPSAGGDEARARAQEGQPC
jgi:hypothetical protein